MRFHSVFSVAKLTPNIGSGTPWRAYVLRVCAEPAFSRTDIVSASVMRGAPGFAGLRAGGVFVLAGMAISFAGTRCGRGIMAADPPTVDGRRDRRRERRPRGS